MVNRWRHPVKAMLPMLLRDEVEAGTLVASKMTWLRTWTGESPITSAEDGENVRVNVNIGRKQSNRRPERGLHSRGPRVRMWEADWDSREVLRIRWIRKDLQIPVASQHEYYTLRRNILDSERYLELLY
jgi:hypothetical protein